MFAGWKSNWYEGQGVNQAVRARRWRGHLLVLLGYLLLSCLLTWPLLAHVTTGVVGVSYGFEDASQNVWNLWWTRQALAQGRNPFWSPLLYYPDGVQLYVQTFNLVSNLVTLPVQLLTTPVAAFNSAVLLACTLTGYAGFLLVRHFVPGRAIPFLAGALLTACPFHVMKLHVNQLNLINLQWIPLYLLALCWLDAPGRGERGPGSRGAVLAAAAIFVLATVTDWYWGLMCGLVTGIWFSLSLLRVRERGRLLRRYLLVGAGVLLGLLPLFIGIALAREHLNTIANEAVWRGYVWGYSADALGLFFPSVYHPVWGAAVERAIARVSPGYATEGWYVAGGWVLLGLAAVGIGWSWREQWQLLVVGGVMWLLSLGPTLRIAGFDTGIPLPYRLLEQVPLLNAARRPSHLAVVCIAVATVFAGIGLHRLHERLHGPRQRAALLLLVSSLAVLELWPPPRDLFTFEQPAFFQHLRERPGAVADLPLEWTETSRSLRGQMVHGQPVLGSYMARRPAYDTYYVPLLHQLGSMEPAPDIVPVGREALMAMQCAYPMRHAIVRKPLVTEQQQAGLAAVLAELNGGPLPPQFADADYAWYELPQFPAACQPFVYLGRGWYPIEEDATRRWRWAGAESDIWLTNPFDTPITVQMSMRIDAFAAPRPVELWRGTRRLAHWAVGDVPRETVLLVQLHPGQNRLQLRAEPWLDAVSGRDLTIPVKEITLCQCIQ